MSIEDAIPSEMRIPLARLWFTHALHLHGLFWTYSSYIPATCSRPGPFIIPTLLVFSVIIISDLLGLEQTLLLEVLGDDDHGLLDTRLLRVDVNLRVLRSLVRCTDASKVLDYAGSRLLVQALRVALLSLLDRNIDKDLDEGQRSLSVRSLRVHLPRRLAVSLVRRDEARQGQSGAVGEQLGHLADAADVLVARLFVKAQVLVQAEADVVAIQAVGCETQVQQVLLEGCGDGGLARGGEAGEPDGGTLLLAEGVALGAG